MANHTVPETILQQLGGGRFAVMTGARSFVGSPDALSFSLPGGGGFTRHGINRVRVVLNGNDLYDIGFFKIRGANVIHVCGSADVYAENLREVFTEATGLATSLRG